MSNEEINEICEKYNIENYTINDDGSIDVNGEVDLSGESLTELPLKFNKVSGNFTCNNNKLTNLIGSPKSCGNLTCKYNNLTSLEGSPVSIDMHFNCSNNQLTSLEYGPEEIGKKYSGMYNAQDNKITSLYGFDTKGYSYLYLQSNPIASVFTMSSVYGKHEFDPEHIDLFKILKVIKGDSVYLKRLKYLSTILDIVIDPEKIEKHYTIL
jgi:hypothetical protein